MAAKNNVHRLGEETEFRRFRLYHSVLEGEKKTRKLINMYGCL